jgi:hypothetical protein|tara:strand:- start:112 stop:288 length:177 start_codon:yes stop_codon:yes gene_type:complete
MEHSEIWAILVLDEEDNTEKKFLIGAGDYGEERIREILKEVSPHYKILTMIPKNENPQ